ncbi:helix-turn-helix domain-containing protein [Enterococcus rivorum]|uniref:Transcriptional regulator n=1 Tax=Enterococcus rivorum TaxID=762845 RepID=A0A1E5KTC6_9ENTE|nr:helix-turn-helix transcriptional regulator [Enterococcus rivorum]MBP2100742.1 transcriptional regulator with XRE-family HTH domain [Enterococcus rivorum]OEH81134.1 transcriptional regulator [Enterococcus rivorum]
MNNFESFFAERLHKFRSKKNVSAREMSLAIGQNENYINSIENKRSLPSLQMLSTICEYLEISISEFLYEPKNHSQLISEIHTSLNTLDDEILEHVLAILKSLNNK